MPNNPSKPENASTKPEMTSTKPENTPPIGTVGPTTTPGRVETKRDADKSGNDAKRDSKRTDDVKPEQKQL